jgi:hypothetical protein
MRSLNGAPEISGAPFPFRQARRSLIVVALLLASGCAPQASRASTPDPSLALTDQRVAVHTLAVQRADGLFVFSVNDSSPPILAETYFAIATLRILGVSVPRTPTLINSLQAFAAARDSEFRIGSFTLAPRDLYELAMLDKLLSTSAGDRVLTAYSSRLMTTALERTDIVRNIRDWYFAVMTVSVTGSQGAAVASAVAAAFGNSLAVLMTIPIADRLRIVALMIDAAEYTAAPVSAGEFKDAWASVGVGSAGSLTTGADTDAITLFYLAIAARESLPMTAIDRRGVVAWLDARAAGDAYTIGPGQPATPIGTQYVLELRSLLSGADPTNLPR